MSSDPVVMRQVGGRGFCLILALAATFAASLPVTAQARPAASAAAQEVARLLAEGLSEDTVVRWLETTARWPKGDLAADDLVALKRAGASEELIQRLLERAAQPAATAPALPTDQAGTFDEHPPGREPTKASSEPSASATPPPGLPATAAAPASPRPALPPPIRPLPATSPEPVPDPPVASAPAPVGTSRAETAAPHGQIRAFFRLRYSPLPTDESELPDLFVYLDGRFLARLPVPASILEPAEQAIELPVVPGVHHLRLAVERHRIEGGRGEEHETRVAEVPLALDMSAGATWGVEIELIEPRLPPRRNGQIGFAVWRDGELVVEQAELGVPPSEWRPLCEDLEAFAGRRRRDDSCITWTELWAPLAEVPSRQAVLDWLRHQGFSPPPGATSP